MTSIKKCSHCGSKKIFVTDTRTNENGIVVRKRICAECGEEFKTLEIRDTDTLVNVTSALDEVMSMRQRVSELYNSLKKIDEIMEG